MDQAERKKFETKDDSNTEIIFSFSFSAVFFQVWPAYSSLDCCGLLKLCVFVAVMIQLFATFVCV